jgi:cytochrome c oxidase cbb3-type subunit 3
MTTETAIRDHSYDGIEEFDNRLPNWWLWTFYLAIIFSAVYWWFFHTLDKGALPLEAYQVDVAEAKAELDTWLVANPVSDELLAGMAQDAEKVAKGRAIFENPKYCMSCHLATAGGAIGPNLTDEYWIYGNAPMDVYTTIQKGRAGGMPEHASKIGQVGVREAAAYVLSLRNTNVSGGKKPEPNAKKM